MKTVVWQHTLPNPRQEMKRLILFRYEKCQVIVAVRKCCLVQLGSAGGGALFGVLEATGSHQHEPTRRPFGSTFSISLPTAFLRSPTTSSARFVWSHSLLTTDWAGQLLLVQSISLFKMDWIQGRISKWAKVGCSLERQIVSGGSLEIYLIIKLTFQTLKIFSLQV